MKYLGIEYQLKTRPKLVKVGICQQNKACININLS